VHNDKVGKDKDGQKRENTKFLWIAYITPLSRQTLIDSIIEF